MAPTNKTWILLRGFTREAGHWGPFLKKFADTFPQDRVTTLDLPGSGEFGGETSPVTISEIVKFLRTKAQERDLVGANTHLFALSLGSMVAIEWMALAPEEVASAILINGSVKGLSPFYNRANWRVWPQLLLVTRNKRGPAWERAVLDIVANRQDKEEWVKIWAEIAQDNPMSMGNILRQLLALATFSQPTQKPRQPALVLCSSGDRLVAPSCSDDIAKWLGCEIHKHPWAGHDLAIDDPDWLLNEAQEWAKTH